MADAQFVGVRTIKPVSLRSLSRDEVEELAGITAGGQNEVVVELNSGEVVHTCDMKLLLFGGWLNSEVINTYMALIEVWTPKLVDMLEVEYFLQNKHLLTFTRYGEGIIWCILT